MHILEFYVIYVCRHFTDLRGTWISTCVLRGEYCPRVFSQALLETSVEDSFETALQRLASDELLADARAKEPLSAALVMLGDLARSKR